MAFKHKKQFGIYHWDTFDNQSLLVDEADTFSEACHLVIARYGSRIRQDGADQVDIVDSTGILRQSFTVG